jgi:hypothetical protein
MTQFNASPINCGNIFDGPTEIYVDNVLLGATVGGVELMHTQELGEKISDQSPLLCGSYLKSCRGSLRFDLEDLSLANMLYAFSNPGVAVGGGNASLSATHEVKLVGHGPGGTTRTFTIWNARFNGNTTGKHQLGESVTFSVELLMESDESKSDGQRYFNVVDA